ncbi:PAS domain S-box protein [Paenibacillus soyae]|uniref:PAS domain S-box protein n=1 Tax=Paenibacillus soyae TaxID=2969249 RepID=A0A9X2SB04_9BACL|nr:PAS domain S-box protein [Paenibacillus soyae]MCR2807214.1 PAS domain S-box protein [Paenibacillus soyae]
MLQQLFSNLTLVLVFLILSAPFYGRYPYTKWTLLHKIGIGVVQGLFGVILLSFTIELDNNVVIDYRYLSILISAYYGGLPSAVVSTVIIAFCRLFYDGTVDETAVLAALLSLGVGISSAIIGRLVYRYWPKWFAMLGFASVSISASLLYRIGPEDGLGVVIQFISLMLVGGLIVAAFIHVQNYLRERAELNKRISRLTEQFQTLELKEVYERTLLEMLGFLRVSFGSIYSVDNGKNKMFCRAVRGKLLEVGPHETHTVTEAMDAVVATGKAAIYPNWRRRRPDSKMEDGLYRMGVRSTIHIPVIYNGKVIAVINLGSDIPGYMSQKQIQLMNPIASLLGFSVSLKYAEGKYKAVSESDQDAVILADSELNIISWNRGAETMFGYSNEEALGMPLCDVISERQRDAYRREMEQYRIAEHDAAWEGSMELEGQRKNRSVFPVDITPNKWQTAGTLYFSCIIRDITVRKDSERLLSESVSKYRALVGHAVDMFFMTEFNPEPMTILEVNERVCQVLGYTREELFKMTPYDLGVQDETLRQGHKHVIQQLVETGFAKFEMRVRSKGGEIIPVESVTKIIELQGKRVSISVLRDMTDRQKTELALKESEERYRRLIELLPDTVAVHANGEVVYVNEAGVRMFGAAKPEDIIGRRLLEFIHPDSRELVKSRISMTLTTQLQAPPVEQRLVRVDGAPFEAIVQSNRIIYRGEESVLVVAHDITERKRAEQAMRESEERYRRVFELSPNAICLYDAEGTIVYANGKAASLFAASELSALLGKNKFELAHPNDRNEVEERFALMLKEELSQMTYESHYLTLSGSVFIAEVSITCVHFGGKPHNLAYIRDISKSREEEEKLQEMNRMLKELSALDGLTGIANRRAFDEAFQQAWQTSAGESSPLSIILFDIDYFKLYNDTYGHLGGDACLKSIASSLKPLIGKPGEVLARYGGEEFVVLLPGADSAAAMEAAERIKGRIASLRIPHKASKVSDYVTVSLGAATMIAMPGLDRTEMVEFADKALYQAKLAGRNRIYTAAV